jgi:hypothetical protein
VYLPQVAGVTKAALAPSLKWKLKWLKGSWGTSSMLATNCPVLASASTFSGPDLVAELAGGQLIGIEVKAGAGATRDDARHLAWLRDETGERFLAGIVLHTGPRP